MLIGYLLTRQADDLPGGMQALAGAGCAHIVEDGTGAAGQPGLRELLSRLRDGDVVVVPALGGSLPDVVRWAGRITATGAGLRSLEEGIDTTTEAGRAAAGVLGSLAALDRGAVQARIHAGLAAARAGGRRGGRRPKLTPQQQALLAEAVLSGRETGARVARRFRVSTATVSRVVAAHRAGAGTAAVMGGAEGGGGQSERSIAGVLPVSALDERLAIVGTSGSGKTYAAKGLVERLMGQGARVCIVDPLGVWWGLRAGAEGGDTVGPHPVVVFGGRHADVALDPGLGTALGQLVGTQRMACVVDVSDLGSAAVRRGFMTLFTEALYEGIAPSVI